MNYQNAPGPNGLDQTTWAEPNLLLGRTRPGQLSLPHALSLVPLVPLLVTRRRRRHARLWPLPAVSYAAARQRCSAVSPLPIPLHERLLFPPISPPSGTLALAAAAAHDSGHRQLLSPPPCSLAPATPPSTSSLLQAVCPDTLELCSTAPSRCAAPCRPRPPPRTPARPAT